MNLEPTIIPAVAVAVVVVAFSVIVLVALATQRPDPAETAMVYEQAWDDLDFELLWQLSSEEMREGRSEAEFVDAKREAYRQRTDLTRLVERVTVERLTADRDRARALTRLELRDGTSFHNEVRMVYREGRWLVDRYRLGPPSPLRAEPE